jgi:hypothetical protein
MKNIALTLALLVIAPVAASAMGLPTKTQSLKAHAALKRVLKDPESVRYVGEWTNPGVVCGVINAKNSMGGYTGNVTYWYDIAADRVEIVQNVTGENDIDYIEAMGRYNRHCQG